MTPDFTPGRAGAGHPEPEAAGLGEGSRARVIPSSEVTGPREVPAWETARRGLPRASPAGLSGQPAPRPRPQPPGRDAPQAAQSPQRRHLARCGRREEGRAEVPPRTSLWASRPSAQRGRHLGSGRGRGREPDDIRALRFGTRGGLRARGRGSPRACPALLGVSRGTRRSRGAAVRLARPSGPRAWARAARPPGAAPGGARYLPVPVRRKPARLQPSCTGSGRGPSGAARRQTETTGAPPRGGGATSPQRGRSPSRVTPIPARLPARLSPSPLSDPDAASARLWGRGRASQPRPGPTPQRGRCGEEKAGLPAGRLT